jgi:PAS domain S-box-containing protein
MTADEIIRLLESMGESYFETDLKGKITVFNDYVCRFHGRSHEELMASDYRTFMRPDQARKVFKVYDEVYRTGLPSQVFSYEIIRKDGVAASAETIVSLRRGPDGEPIGFCGISRDVTEKKKTETALRQSEEKHRSILANIEESYYEVDLKGTFTFVNAAACRTLSCTRDELIGMNYRDCMSPPAAAETFRVFNEIFRSGGPAKTFQCELIRKDGSTCLHEMSISPLRHISAEIVGFSGISRDLTERLRMEKKLRESEESYRSIMDLSPDAITINRADDGRYVQINRTFCKDTGYSLPEIIGRTPLELNLFAEPDGHSRMLEAFGNGTVHGLELQFRAKDGSILDVLVSAAPIHFKGQSCILFICTTITPLKKVQQALRESEESYRRIIELAPDSITVDRMDDGEFFEVNASFCHNTGFHREAVIGKTALELNLYRDFEDRRTFTEALRQSGRVDGVEITFLAKDGTPLINLVSARIIQFKGETCILTVATLINELKAAQQALEEREAGYRTILETAPNAIALTRLSDNRFVQVNHAFCTKLGFTREAIIDRTPDELKVYVDSSERRRMMHTILRKGRLDGMEMRFRSRGGQNFDGLLSINPIRYKGEDCLLIIIVDITARKQAQQELEQYRCHLEDRVLARTRELQAAQMELIKREKLSVLGQLTATVSHELRNPLGVIRSSNYYLQRRIKEKDDKVEKHFKRIEEQIALCDTIVADLLEFTRGRSVNIVTEALGSWLEELLSQTRENEGLDIEMEMESHLPPVPHDRDKLRRAILNVLDNAIQAVRARRKGGGTCDGQYVPKIILQTKKMENHFLICIIDNGIGMNQETLARAFEPLFTTRARGTGIGLANVKKIVEEHGGSVALESKCGEGTRLTISLPFMN